MAQVCGYLVCLVAVITFIICLADIIPSIMLSSSIILVSVVLFVTHWIWIRSLMKKIISGQGLH